MIAAPPRPPQPDELEALIEEARRRARRRRIGISVGALVAVVVVVAGAAIGGYRLASDKGSRHVSSGHGVPAEQPSSAGALVLWGTLWGRASLYAVRADGSHFRRLLAMHDPNEIPALEPNGSRLAFSQGGRNGGLGYVNLSSGRVTPVADTAGVVIPEWAPDGQHIVYRMCVTFRCSIWSMRPDGTERHLLSKGLNPLGSVAISPDSGWIAVVSLDHPPGLGLKSGEPGRLYVMRLDGSERRLLDSAVQYPVVWSKQGILLRQGSGIVALSLSGKVRPYLSGRGVGDMVVSPDGKWLALAREGPGGVRVSVGRADRNGLHIVYTSPLKRDPYPLVWSADSQRLSFTESERHSRTFVEVLNPSSPDEHSEFRVFHVVRPLGWSAAAARSPLVAGPVPCRRNDFRVAIGLNGATGSIVGIPHVVSHTAACHLDASLRFSVRTPTGSLVRGIRGNPAIEHLHGSLTPTNPIGRAWAWRNWCGRTDLVFTASVAGQTVTQPLARRGHRGPPRCAAAGSPSTLTRFGS